MGVRKPLPQGPVLPCSAGFFSPPAPRSSGRIGPAQCKYEFRVRFNPNDFRAGLKPALFSLDDGEQTSEHACARLRRRSSVYWIAASVAPRIVFGFSTVPLCTKTAASSIFAPL